MVSFKHTVSGSYGCTLRPIPGIGTGMVFESRPTLPSARSSRAWPSVIIMLCKALLDASIRYNFRSAVALSITVNLFFFSFSRI
jgi:hypothetical protein